MLMEMMIPSYDDNDRENDRDIDSICDSIDNDNDSIDI